MNAEQSRLALITSAIACGGLVFILLCCGCSGCWSSRKGPAPPTKREHAEQLLNALPKYQREYANRVIANKITHQISVSGMAVGDIGTIVAPIDGIQIIRPGKILCYCDYHIGTRQMLIDGVETDELVSDTKYYWSQKYVFAVVGTETFTTVLGASRSAFKLEVVNTEEVERAVQAMREAERAEQPQA